MIDKSVEKEVYEHRCGSQVWMEWKMGRSFSLIQQHMIACMLSILVGLALGASIFPSLVWKG
jgi:hypothetical protein